MTKVLYNDCYGGYGISYTAWNWLRRHGMPEKYMCTNENLYRIAQAALKQAVYNEETGELIYVFDTKEPVVHTDEEMNQLVMIYTEIPRHHPLLIQCVEELGLKEASGPCSELKIDEIIGDKYYIEDVCDGIEAVHEDEYEYYDGPYNVNEI